MSELNRRGRRSKHEGSGKILLGIFRSVPCIVTDLSNSGARICVAENQAIPASFRLQINGYRRKMKAETRWRKGDDIGVEFSLD